MDLDELILRLHKQINEIPMLGGENEDLLRECLSALEDLKESTESLEEENQNLSEENRLLSLRISKLIAIGGS